MKAKLHEMALVDLLGRARDEVPVYGSGGFTAIGIPRVKMKIAIAWGSRPGRDLERITKVRAAIGDQAELFVDANGGYTRKQAVRLARHLSEQGATWFEEPVSSDDLHGLNEIRAMTDMNVAAGEYGSDLVYFEHMCEAGAVDVLQADVSRCAGITEWMRVAAVAAAHGLQVSGHCAQSLHAHPACAVANIRHLEYFHDHARLDRLLFDRVLDPNGGCCAPTGLELVSGSS
ncbi:MAG: enolase C-terminal domain-like protein [Acidimicrobiales bacterium]